MIIWFTGLSGAGKTTLSNLLEKRLKESGRSVCQVDGDIFREKEKSRNSFSRSEILNNNCRMIDHCRSILQDYDFILVSAISPYQETRQKAREVFGREYLEVFLNPPLKELQRRDTKQLYAKAIAGEIDNLIGVSESSPYEEPSNPEITIDTSLVDIESSLNIILETINNHGFSS